MSAKDQDIVDHAEEVTSAYVRKLGDEGGEANERSLTEMRKRGIKVSLNTDQYERDRLVGHAEIDGVKLDLSDAPVNSHDDD